VSRRTTLPGSRGRATVLAAALAVTALGAAACGGGETVVTPEAAVGSGYPSVAVPQAQGILEAVDLAVANGTQKRSAAAFGDRVIGPYRNLALAKGKIEAARKAKPAVPEFEQLRLVVPDATAWPRFFVAVGNVKGQPTPVLRVLLSPTARTQYGLWSELSMLPGATMPQMAPATAGAPALAQDDASLVQSPKDVVTKFATYLNSSGRQEGATFERNEFADQVISRLAEDRKRLKAAATVTSKHEPDLRAVFTLRTADGGAIVIGAVTQRYTVAVKAGQPGAKVDPALAALAGGKVQFGKSFTRTAVQVVAFSVPKRGGGPVTVFAAQKGDVAAAAS
jgi:hypothetical protein